MAETEAVSSEVKPPPPPPAPPPILPVQSLSPSSSKKKMSNACEVDRNKETDSDIFALGEAVSQLDIDDVLSGVGSDFSELLNADDGSVTTTSCRLPAADHLKPAPTLDKYSTIQVPSHSRLPLILCYGLPFCATVCKTVRPMLSDRCLSWPVCL